MLSFINLRKQYLVLLQFKIAGVFVAGYTSELQLDPLYLAVLASKFTPKGAVVASYMAGA